MIVALSLTLLFQWVLRTFAPTRAEVIVTKHRSVLRGKS